MGEAGFFPFSIAQVLRAMQAPCTKSNPTKITKATANDLSYHELLETLVTAEVILSLHGPMEQNAHTHDEASKQRLLMCAHKISKCPPTSIAECALLKDGNELLSKQAN